MLAEDGPHPVIDASFLCVSVGPTCIQSSPPTISVNTQKQKLTEKQNKNKNKNKSPETIIINF